MATSFITRQTLKFFIIGVALALGLGALRAPHAQAVSAYDDWLLGDMVIANGSGFTEYESANIYGDYQLAFQHYAETTCNSAESAWLSNSGSAGYYEYMEQLEVNNAGTNQFTLRWYFGWNTTKPTTTFEGTSPAVNLKHTGNFHYRVTFQRGSSGGLNYQSTLNPDLWIGVTCTQSSGSVNSPTHSLKTSTGWYQMRPIFSKNLTITYPSGYEGETIPYNY